MKFIVRPACLYRFSSGFWREVAAMSQFMTGERRQLQKGFPGIQPMQVGGPFKRPRHRGFQTAGWERLGRN